MKESEGATNLLTGVADAYLDRAPLVALTAQVSLDRMHKESHQSIDCRNGPDARVGRSAIRATSPDYS